MQNNINISNTQNNINNIYEKICSVANAIENDIIYELDESKWHSNTKNKLIEYLNYITNQMNDFNRSLKNIENLFPKFEKINDLNNQIENLEKENMTLELSLKPEDNIKLQTNKNKIEELKIELIQIKKNIRMEWM